MDALHAAQFAECLEIRLGSRAEDAKVDCFAVPRRPGSTRRRSRWSFLIFTDLPELRVREATPELTLEVVDRRGSRWVMVGWP